jgi:hypothetical protein
MALQNLHPRFKSGRRLRPSRSIQAKVARRSAKREGGRINGLSAPVGKPIFQFKFDHFVRRWHNGRFADGLQWTTDRCVGDAFAFRNLLTPKPLAVRASKKGGGFQNLHSVTGYPLV